MTPLCQTEQSKCSQHIIMLGDRTKTPFRAASSTLPYWSIVNGALWLRDALQNRGILTHHQPFLTAPVPIAIGVTDIHGWVLVSQWTAVGRTPWRLGCAGFFHKPSWLYDISSLGLMSYWQANLKRRGSSLMPTQPDFFKEAKQYPHCLSPYR